MRITLRRSLIGVPKDQRATVYALGLKKTGDTRVVADTRDVAGMVGKVAYLLTIDAPSDDGTTGEGQAPQ